VPKSSLSSKAGTLMACLGNKLSPLICVSACSLGRKLADKSSWPLGYLAYENCEVMRRKRKKEKNM